MDNLYLILSFTLGLTIGLVIIYFILTKLHRSKLALLKNEVEQKGASLEKDLLHQDQLLDELRNELKEFKVLQINWSQEKLKISNELTQSESNLSHLNERLGEQKGELITLQQKFQKEFQLIADQMLKQNANEISISHQKELNQLLNPLKEKINQFEANIEKKYIDETKERANLKTELAQLLSLNKTLNLQAENLTTALKGENKTQGNWGEMILERILESSGLQKGEEYETQFSDTNSENKRIQPDVIIKLPENKHLIIDSKVSLVAYESYTSSTDTNKREVSLKAHLSSIKNHVKGLGEKNYQTGSSLQSPDFVLLFMPIEAAFSLALQNESQLFNYAWERKVVLVSPTTLLASLRTISSVWKNERQTKNAQDIAEKAGNLYDKFVGFLEDMEKIDKSLKTAQNHYNDAFNKLSTGRGNLVTRAEKIKQLGAKANKSIPNNLLDEGEN